MHAKDQFRRSRSGRSVMKRIFLGTMRQRVCGLSPRGLTLAAGLAVMTLTSVFPSTFTSASPPSEVRPAALDPGVIPVGAAAQGSLAASQELQLSVVLPPSNPAELRTLLSELYDPKSALFHKWLQPGQFV